MSCQYDNEGNEYKVGLLNSFKWYSLCSGGVCHMLYFLATIKWYWYCNKNYISNLYYHWLKMPIDGFNGFITNGLCCHAEENLIDSVE